MRSSLAGVAVLLVLGLGCTFPGDGGGDDGEEPPPPDDPMPPQPPEPTIDALQAFSGCPEVEDLVEIDFAEEWSRLGTDSGACETCHVDASSGYEPIVNDNVTALDQMTTSAARMRVFFAVVGDDIVVDQTLVRVASGESPHTQHPRYDEDGAVDALEVVYERAYSRHVAGTCGPPRY
jgi:hypothetical protein